MSPILQGPEEYGVLPWPIDPPQGVGEPPSGTTTSEDETGPQNARSGRGRIPYPGGSWFDDPEDGRGRLYNESGRSMTLEELVEEGHTREVRRCRLYGIALGLVVGYIAGLTTWALWYALGHPASWQLVEAR